MSLLNLDPLEYTLPIQNHVKIRTLSLAVTQNVRFSPLSYSRSIHRSNQHQSQLKRRRVKRFDLRVFDGGRVSD